MVTRPDALLMFSMCLFWGRKDDAVDRLAAVVMMQFGDDVANA